MASINFATREINCKIVYYGPGLSGKTTNLQVIHQKLPQDKRSDMVSLATEQDRTLFFDFLPLDLGSIKGFKTKFQLYTVPGQVYYNSTRKLVLRGVDGVVFVADSQKNRMAENLESLQNLSQNLKEYGFDLEQIPYVLQYNKRDMPDVFTVDELNSRLNPGNVEVFEAISHVGKGVVPTLKCVSKKVIDKFNKRQSSMGGVTPKPSSKPAAKSTAAQPAAKAAPEAPVVSKPANTQPPLPDLDLKPPAGTPKAEPSTPSLPDLDLQSPADTDLKLSPPASSTSSNSKASTSTSSAPKTFGGDPFAPKKPKSVEPTQTKPSSAAQVDDEEEEEDIELRPYIPKAVPKDESNE